MNFQSPFKGQITILSANNKRVFKYDITPEKPVFRDLLMCNFKSLGLTTHEKRNLSNKHRELIHRFKKVKVQEIRELSNDLVSFVKKHCKEHNSLYIQAEGFGSFICLGSIMSNELPTNVEFELQCLPMKLFPKTLMKKRPSKFYPINFIVKEQSWLSELQSLYWNPEVVSNLNFVQNESAAPIAA